jgi:type II secretory pathway component PulF
MAEYPRNFSPVVIAMIAAGEVSGQLAEAFKASLSHMEREAAFRARVLSALIYPAILAFAGTAALSVLVLFVLPRFAELILAGGGRLPALPMLMLTAASAVQRYWPVLLALALLLSTAAAGALRSPERRLTVSRLSFAIPLIGSTRRMIAGAHFARALGMLVAGGTPIVQALDRTAAATRDPSVRSAIEVVRDRVRAGHAFSDAARRSGFIPPLGAQLIGIGERSGDLSGHLLHAADILEGDLERRISRLLTLVEPAMIVIFGAIIGLTALGLMQAVYGVHGGVLK